MISTYDIIAVSKIAPVKHLTNFVIQDGTIVADQSSRHKFIYQPHEKRKTNVTTHIGLNFKRLD